MSLIFRRFSVNEGFGSLTATDLVPKEVLQISHSSRPSAAAILASSSNMSVLRTAMAVSRCLENQRKIDLFEDLGNLSFPIEASPLAQQYFNQGFRLLAAFDFRRAVISFRAAQDADASCALCVWGEAFALGPNLNSFDEPRLLASVPAAFQKAQQAEKMQSSSQLELGLIRALQARYVRTVEDYVENESELTAGFAAEMEGLLTRFGGARANPNLAALTADALMNMSPWNYWINGHLRPTSLRAKSMLQEALSVSPRHAFCIHLLVHVTEASGNQTLLQEVRPWAEVLPQLMPGAPHLIHMSFHTLMHTGDFHLADGDNTLATELPRQIYPMHNLDTLSWLCRIEGRSLCALDAAKSLEQKALPLIGTGTFETGFPPARFAAVWPLTLVAFGRTKQILSEGLPRQCQQDAFLAGIWHFARGVALVKQLREVRKELEFLREKRIEVEAGLSSPPGMAWKNFHGSKQWAVYPAGRILRLAEEELEARMAELRRVDEQELFRWKEAFRLEADLPYDEPPSWLREDSKAEAVDLPQRLKFELTLGKVSVDLVDDQADFDQDWVLKFFEHLYCGVIADALAMLRSDPTARAFLRLRSAVHRPPGPRGRGHRSLVRRQDVRHLVPVSVAPVDRYLKAKAPGAPRTWVSALAERVRWKAPELVEKAQQWYLQVTENLLEDARCALCSSYNMLFSD
eukprot:g23655.t1